MSVRCVAGAPLRSPPRLREGATGPQRTGLGSGLRATSAHRDSRIWQILVRVGRNRKQAADLGTLKEYRQEVKSMNKIT
jgi:hypothetical protein